jgi:homoserine dehydrogenase
VNVAWSRNGSAAEEESDRPLYVLKFGSSILRTSDDLARVAGEIYRQRRFGRRIIAVVSALAGDTDDLLRQAAKVTGLSSCRGVPDLVSLGEERTAALLRLACDRIGLRAEICRPEELGLRTEGDGLAARPAWLEPAPLLAKLRSTGVVVVPGFVGLDEAGERTLLGRGGSDFSAIFIGGELGAECVRLYKDVDGVFERDPAQDRDARRFARISWADALRIARPLIQPQALEYAAGKSLPVEVEALGSPNPTRVGPSTGSAEPVAVRRPLRVSIAGFGTVGQALAERLAGEASFEIVATLVRDTGRSRAVAPPVPLTADRGAFLACETDIIIDALSCEETGSLLCDIVLPKGVSIVSASKRVISAGHGRLTDAAVQGGSQLLYSAAVGGSAAVLETIDRARAEGEIVEVVGVLNGTVNFILQRLSQGAAFAVAVQEAQARGFAEEDPEADLSGTDAEAKLRLIANRATGVDPQALDIVTERLDAAAAERISASGERWVQVARAARRSGRLEASVTLQPLREVEALPAILDEWNCAAVKLADGRIYRCVGRGAGGAATAEAIVADLYELLGTRDRADSRTAGRPC